MAARRGTGFDTRLTVIERGTEPGIAVDGQARAATLAALLDAVIAHVPPRLPIEPEPVRLTPAAVAGRDLFGNAVAPPKTGKPAAPTPKSPHDWGPVVELAVETAAPETGAGAPAAASAAGPYEPWRPSVARVPGAIEHPTPLVQSGAMAAVSHPVPAYRPICPERVVTDGLLSNAQLESVVLAGEAHSRHLAVDYRIGSGWETVHRCQGEDGEDIDTSFVTTDAGEALIGRVLDASQVRAVRTSFGLGGDFAMTGTEAFEAVMGRGTALALANGWRLARRRIMGADRVEIEGPADGDTDALKRMGCTVEIVSWRARAFAPGAPVLDRILERWPLAA